MAYHTWLYHFLGGSSAKLMPPPSSAAASETRWSVKLRLDAQHAEAAYSREFDRLRKARQSDVVAAQLHELRFSLVDPAVLRPTDFAASSPPAEHPPGSAAPPGAPPPGPDPAALERRERVRVADAKVDTLRAIERDREHDREEARE